MTYTFHQAPDLDQLRRRAVIGEAFQMLCTGCVQHSQPQVQRIHEVFSGEDVMALGLHTLFEHHAAMTHPEVKDMSTLLTTGMVVDGRQGNPRDHFE